MNNVYTGWKMYAVGGSANPTINSQGNLFIALDGDSAKEVMECFLGVGERGMKY